jgi:hypothetical protein
MEFVIEGATQILYSVYSYVFAFCVYFAFPLPSLTLATALRYVNKTAALVYSF